MLRASELAPLSGSRWRWAWRSPPSNAVPATPQQTTASFADWTLRCTQAGSGPRVCEVVQGFQQNDRPVAQIAAGRPQAGQKLQLTILVPPNISLPAGAILLAGAEGEPPPTVALAWRRCVPMGCIADAALDPEVVTKLRGWTAPGRVVFVDAAGRPGCRSPRAAWRRHWTRCRKRRAPDDVGDVFGRQTTLESCSRRCQRAEGRRPMRSYRSLMLAVSVSAGLPLACLSPAAAQGSPSADQIMRSLQPTGGVLGTTRGIRPVGPSAPAATATPATASHRAASPSASSAAAPITPATMPSVSLMVQFPNGSAELTPQAMKTSAELGKALSSNSLSSYRFRIEGHADTVGMGEPRNRRVQVINLGA